MEKEHGQAARAPLQSTAMQGLWQRENPAGIGRPIQRRSLLAEVVVCGRERCAVSQRDGPRSTDNSYVSVEAVTPEYPIAKAQYPMSKVKRALTLTLEEKRNANIEHRTPNIQR